jgi:hypothetical protein
MTAMELAYLALDIYQDFPLLWSAVRPYFSPLSVVVENEPQEPPS